MPENEIVTETTPETEENFNFTPIVCIVATISIAAVGATLWIRKKLKDAKVEVELWSETTPTDTETP